MISKCPHCKNRIEIALFARGQTTGNKRVFQSTSDMVDNIPPHWDGAIRRFIYRRLFKPQDIITGPQERIVVRSEIKTSNHQILIKELGIRATEAELRQLADVYVRRGESWARNTTEQQTTMGQGKHNNIKDDFLELGFLKRVSLTQYELTPPGLRFLRHYMA